MSQCGGMPGNIVNFMISQARNQVFQCHKHHWHNISLFTCWVPLIFWQPWLGIWYIKLMVSSCCHSRSYKKFQVSNEILANVQFQQNTQKETICNNRKKIERRKPILLHYRWSKLASWIALSKIRWGHNYTAIRVRGGQSVGWFSIRAMLTLRASVINTKTTFSMY